METCPICAVRIQGLSVCRRCGADWTRVVAVLADAREHLRSAREAYMDNEADAMLLHAKRAYSKRRSRAARRLLASAAALNRDFELALRIWRLDRQDPTGNTQQSEPEDRSNHQASKG